MDFLEKIYNDLLSLKSDRYIDNLFLMDNPTYILLITGFYLAFVLKLGPNMMKNRKPMDLKRPMQLYNLFQIVANGFMLQQLISSTNIFDVYTKCPEKNNFTDKYIQFLSWLYFVTKISDLLDTVFFVLRKKQNQVTFLHVYHHTIMVAFSWFTLKFIPGHLEIAIGCLNAVVHVIMYFYYFVAALGPQFQKYLWWKKYMTTIQLVQFVLMLVYLFNVFTSGCNQMRPAMIFYCTNVVIFLALFINFYKKTYKPEGKLENKPEKFQNGGLMRDVSKLQ